MTEAEALALCAAAKAASPFPTGVYHVYQDVADALGASDIGPPFPNLNFSRTNKQIGGDAVIVFHRAGSEVRYAPTVPQTNTPRVRDAHLHDPNQQPAVITPRRIPKP